MSRLLRRPRAALLAALAALCFLAQPLVLPLHLALVEHTFGGAHAHAGQTYQHDRDHDHAGHDGDHGHDGEHDPPPAEDHLDEPDEPATSPRLAGAAVVPPPMFWASQALAPTLPCRSVSGRDVPRTPPLRARAAPRAPPAVA